MDPRIQPGQKAAIKGLLKRDELNGTVCTIKKKLNNGRVAVEVISLSGTLLEKKEVVAIKPVNLNLQWTEINGEVAGSDTKHWGMEEEECPLCMDKQMNTGKNARRMTCCGAAICLDCFVLCTEQKAACPLCRAHTSNLNDEARFKRLMARAKRGDANACYNVGCMYDEGNYGVRQDKALARVWYKKGAEKGETRAAYNLAFCCQDGEGGPVDKKLAVKYLRMAAEKGHIQAMTCLGDAILRGDGAEKDVAEAKKWLTKGAKAGDGVAQQQLDFLEMMSSMDSGGANVSFGSFPGGVSFSSGR